MAPQKEKPAISGECREFLSQLDDDLWSAKRTMAMLAELMHRMGSEEDRPSGDRWMSDVYLGAYEDLHKLHVFMVGIRENISELLKRKTASDPA